MRKQRGYLNISDGDMLFGCMFVIVAAAVIGGGVIYWLIPKVWEWIKPIIHQVTA